MIKISSNLNLAATTTPSTHGLRASRFRSEFDLRVFRTGANKNIQGHADPDPAVAVLQLLYCCRLAWLARNANWLQRAKVYHFAFAVRYEAVSAGFVDCQDCAAGRCLVVKFDAVGGRSRLIDVVLEWDGCIASRQQALQLRGPDSNY